MVTLQEIFERLLNRFGRQNWWPGESLFEIIAGAILTQNTSWKNVEQAINNLRDESLLCPKAMRMISVDKLADIIRPAGYFRLKARRLSNFVSFLFDQYDGDVELMFESALDTLRQELLNVNGIGPETADSILLYAGNQPTFVVDAYTARIGKRHQWMEPDADYYAIKDYFEFRLDKDVQLFNEFHALIVQVGKQYCKKTPQCQHCPLAFDLPENGPVDLAEK